MSPDIWNDHLELRDVALVLPALPVGADHDLGLPQLDTGNSIICVTGYGIITLGRTARLRCGVPDTNSLR